MAETRRHGRWLWPEQRLTYANATLPEAMIAAGSVLGRPILVAQGLELLEWLLARETRHGHLSVTPVGGSGPDDEGPGFDQQPIEVAALADACARAEAVTGDRRWAEGITAAANWFLGDNDSGVAMWDPDTGGAFDGLEETRRQSQPGYRVDACPPLDTAARTVPLERLAVIGQGPSFVDRSPAHIAADTSRVVTRLFVPGHEGFDQQESRSAAVLRRLLALSDEEVQSSYDDVHARFDGRHHGLTETFLRHADELSDRLDPELQLSPTRRLLLGATFTSEYAIEGAALCNPSMVLHPDQAGTEPGHRSLRHERPSDRRGPLLFDRVPDGDADRFGRHHF